MSEYFGNRKIAAGWVSFAVVLGILLYVFSRASGILIEIFIDGLNTNIFIRSYTSPPFVSFDDRWFWFQAVTLVPLIEEIVFRKYLYRIVSARLNWILAIVLVSLLFAILHTFNHDNYLVPQFFIAAVIYQLLYIRTQKVLYPFLTHAIGNLLVLLPKPRASELFRHVYIESIDVMVMTVVVVFAVSAAMVCFVAVKLAHVDPAVRADL